MGRMECFWLSADEDAFGIVPGVSGTRIGAFA